MAIRDLARPVMLAAALVTLSWPVVAQEDAADFSFEALIETMRARAAEPDQPPEKLTGYLENLSYDDYRNIIFRRDKWRWKEDPSSEFHVGPFHPGWLYEEPVFVHEIVDGKVREFDFSTDDFEYWNNVGDEIPEGAVLPGIAGLKVNTTLNQPGIFDELITFVGASYFRALGKGNSYGLSARGLSVNTWLDGPEEFPRFSEFWLERPTPGETDLTIYAALDGPSVTGAYKFVLQPGEATTVEVDATLFFREHVPQLGLAPLTSMFYFAEHSERRFDDYRPQVHDSDAVKIVRQDGDVLIRPLNNPPRVSNSYFAEPNLKEFGLIQRDRSYESFQDAGARYHDRPSVMVEPLNDWGPGKIRLVEIPADLEIDDNIVMLWVPDAAPLAGEERRYAYRMHWGALPPNRSDDLAWVISTRTGVGGPSGVPITNPNWRKFVVDFEGGALGAMPGDAELTPVVTASAGEITGVVLHKVEPESGLGSEDGRWRLIVDLDGGPEELIEMTAHVAGADRKLTETWLFQWARTPEPMPDATPAEAEGLQLEPATEASDAPASD